MSQLTAYAHVDHLVPGTGPMLVLREPGWVLVVMQIGAPKADIVAAVVALLNEQEQNLYRAAYGMGPVGTPLNDTWLTDEPIPCWVPPSLRLPCYQYPERRQDPVARELWAMVNGERQNA